MDIEIEGLDELPEHLQRALLMALRKKREDRSACAEVTREVANYKRRMEES